MGFDPPSLEAAANWCPAKQKVNYQEALGWINTAIDPSLGGVNNFRIMSIKAGLLEGLNRKDEADKLMLTAMETASVTDLQLWPGSCSDKRKVKKPCWYLKRITRRAAAPGLPPRA